MKKILLFSLMFIISFFIFGCTNEPITTDNNQIKIVNNDTTFYISIGNKETFKLTDLPTFTNDGYDFLGWTKNKESVEYLTEAETYNYFNGITLYTNWEKTYINPFEITSIGTIYLEVSDKITSKEEYVDATFKLNSDKGNQATKSVSIRLRGNSSLTAPKKSYKLKFSDKVDLMGMGKDKEWALIANYYDPSLIRNFLAYRLAKAMGMEFSVDCEFVEVYLNGYHQGLYLLCETVKTSSARVDIETDYDENTIDIPFLLELDMKMISPDDPQSNGILNVDYFILNSYKRYPIACKYPKTYTTDNITQTQYEYIKNYMKNVYNQASTNNYQQLLDINSCIDFYLIQELFMNIDMDYSSVFMYKKQNGKLQFGPVWDFDISVGNSNYVNNYSANNKMANVNGGSYLFNTLMKHSDFRQQFMIRLFDVIQNILPDLFNSFTINYEMLKNCAIMDNQIWNTLDTEYWPKPKYLVGISYIKQLEYVKTYLDEHSKWMCQNY